MIARDSKAIAISSKRDSSAMKTIALLTMVFLPGTAIAVRTHKNIRWLIANIKQSFFAMPFFDFTVDVDGHSVVQTRPQFWMYWVITIPLTFSVLGLWVVWLRFVTKRHKKEDEEALGTDKASKTKAE
jgi:hypothetical protein